MTSGTGHAEGEKFGVNPVMARAIAELTENRDHVKSYVAGLQKVFSAKEQ
jgi:hypothetical protein